MKSIVNSLSLMRLSSHVIVAAAASARSALATKTRGCSVAIKRRAHSVAAVSSKLVVAALPEKLFARAKQLLTHTASLHESQAAHRMLRLDSIDGIVASASEPSPTHFQARSQYDEPSFHSNNQSVSYALSPHREFTPAPQANVDVRIVGSFRLASGAFVPHGVCWAPACVVDCNVNADDPSAHAVSCLVRYPLSRTAWEEWVPSSSLRTCRSASGSMSSSAQSHPFAPGALVEICDYASSASAPRGTLWYEAVVCEEQNGFDSETDTLAVVVEGCSVCVRVPLHRVFESHPQIPISSEQVRVRVASNSVDVHLCCS
jgi:hypothetical protein